MSHTPRKLALISGAAGGIGAAFATELAIQDYDLILLDRQADVLHTFAATLADTGVEVTCWVADLALPAEVERIALQMADLGQLDLLVNNAGFCVNGAFPEQDAVQQSAMVNVHVLAAVRFTRAVLPGMLHHAQGAVINLSSLTVFRSRYSDLLYGTTKRFLLEFSRGLAQQTTGSGVRVQALCPGYTHTQFHNSATYQGGSGIPGIFWMDASDVVKQSLAALSSRRVVCIPGYRNRLLFLLAKCPPLLYLFMGVLYLPKKLRKTFSASRALVSGRSD